MDRAYLGSQYHQRTKNPDTAQDLSIPASLGSQVDDRVQSRAELYDKASDPVDAGMDAGSDSGSSSTVCSIDVALPHQAVQSEVLQAAALLSRLDSMESATTQALYEERLAT